MKTKVMMFVAAVGMAFAAQAATKTVDGVTYTYEGGVIYKIEGDAKVINIPQKLDSIEVVCWLQEGCLQNNTTVMKVTIPESVIEISQSAFKGCVSLTSIRIPSGVTKINNHTFSGCSNLRSVSLPQGLRSIGYEAFMDCSSLAGVELTEGLNSIDTRAFVGCSALTAITIPESVTSLGGELFGECESLVRVEILARIDALMYCTFVHCPSLKSVVLPDGLKEIAREMFIGDSIPELIVPASVVILGSHSLKYVDRVIFQGKPPAGLAQSDIASVVFPKEYGELWRAQLEVANIGGYANPNKPVVTVVSSKVREDNPTVLDVVYKVTSTKPTVKVRALAFEDGERTLYKVTRPETFIDGTAANLGDAIAPNVEHKLSWQVSSDFKTDLAKMKFEVLAVEDGILPLEFITIPANGTNKKMQLSWNLLTKEQLFDALLWLYADKDVGMALANGVLKNGTTLLASGSSIATVNSESYIFAKMGFSVLSGDALTYANEMTRLGLSPSGIRQYAWRWVEE